MKKLKLCLLASAFVGGVNFVSAQTDVTSTYIANAGFEGTYTNKIQNSSGSNLRYVREPNGWTLAYSNGCEWDASILTKDDDLYNSIKEKITIPADGRGNKTYAVRLHGNANNSQITLTQEEKTFPKGKYTLTGSFYTQNQNELEVGFFFATYSTDTRVKYAAGNESWKSLKTTFESDGTYKTSIGVFFKHNSSNSMIAGVDNITLSYENVNGPELANLIAKATAINGKLGTLTNAINSAQSAYNGINHTEDYQETIDDAITNLQSAITTAISNYSYNPAGDDVSTLLLDNPGFDIDINFASSSTSSTSAATVYPTFGWNPTVPGNCTGATIGYGYTGKINGDGNVTAPTNNADNTTDGGALAICVGWSGTVKYLSTAKTFKAGSYRITYRAYNGNTKNTTALEIIPLVGFVPTSGNSQINNTTETFTNQAWTEHTYSFTLASDIEGQLQIGMQPTTNTNSYNAPELFIDDIKLEYFNPLTLAQIQWQETWDALDALDETALPDAAETAITAALAETKPTTVEGYNTAKAALQALIDSYDGIKAAYDKVLDLIDFVTDEKNNSTGTKTTIETAISTATTNIETRTTASDLGTDYSTLETARQTYVTSGAQPTADHVFDYTFKMPDAAITSANDWTNKRLSNNQQYTGAPDNTYFDAYNENRNIQKNIGTLRLGKYELKCATRAEASVSVGNIYVSQNGANLNQTNINHVGNTGGELGNGWSWTTVSFDNYEDSKGITLGFYSECGSNKWAGADDFHLYYKGNTVDDETAAALAATVVDGKMNATVASTQSSALSAFESAQTFENYNALKEAIEAASASKAAYTKLKGELDKIPSALGTTNIYTESSYATNYTDVLATYTDNSISTVDANAYAYGERVTGAMPAIMLSSWKVGETAALTDASLYMNAWSTEGNSDGSEMTTPFYEYWVSAANALAEKTFMATVEGLTAGTNYLVTAKVRVRQQNDQTKADDDVTFQVNDGDVVNAADGTQSDVRSEMYYKTVRAFGEADGDGKLAIKVVVKDGNHVSWLAFKDVHYSEVTTPTDAHKTALASAISTAEAKTIGFAAGEYAPYTNIAARKALAAAKAINVDVNTDYEVVAATTALTGATWTANAEEMNAVSDELFNGTEYGAAGWTRTQTWNNSGTGIYSVPAGTMTYGDMAYHEMPLEGNTVYKLTFGHRKWDGSNADNGGQVSVLNGSSEGLALTAYTGTSSQSLQNETYFFRTGAAGNYTFTVIAASGRLTFGNVVIKKAVAENLTITEDATAAPAYNYANVTLARSFNAGWNAVCLPFATAAFDNAEIAELTGESGESDALTLTFEKKTAFEANKPYLVYFPEAVAANKTINGVIVNPSTVSASTTNFDFKGVYTVTDIESGNWVISGGQLKKASDAISLKPTRTYFAPKGTEARIAGFTVDGEEVTGLKALFAQEGAPVEGIYNLKGQKVSGQLKKGVYVVNGKKVVK